MKIKAEKTNRAQDDLVCPVCGKSFKKSENTKYIAGGGLTCGWACFLTYVKKNPIVPGKKRSN